MSYTIKDFLKFRKINFNKRSIAIFIIILLPSVITMIFNLYKGDEMPALLYGIFTTGDVFIAFFVPILIVGNYNMNKYMLYTTLPIKNSNLFKYLYMETYLIIILAFVITGIINFAVFDIYSLFAQLFKMVIILCLSNFFIPRIATEEFVLNTEKQQMNLVLSVVVMVLLITMFISILIISGPETLSSFFNSSIANTVIISLWIVGTLIAILTLKKSYLCTMNKVRLMKPINGNNK